jgi:CRP/FNR family transcriptional regulator, cyclic AMP receptor protein
MHRNREYQPSGAPVAIRRRARYSILRSS